MTAAGRGGETNNEGRSPRRSARLTAWLGIAQAILLLASAWLLSLIPGPTASDEEFVEFYASDNRRLVVLLGIYLMPFAAIAFLWFAVALRVWVAQTSTRPQDALLSNVQLVSAILFVALFLSSAAASTVLAVTVELADTPIEPTTARQFPQFGTALLLIFAMRMAAMFIFTTSGLARVHAGLPRWFVWSGYLVGLFLLLSFSLNPILVLVFPVWVLALSVILLLKSHRLPKGQV